EGSSAPVGSLIAVIAGADEDVESLVAEAAPASGKEARPDEASEAAEAKPAATVESPDSRTDAGDGDRGAPAAGEGEEAAGKAPKSNGSGARRTPRREGGLPWPSSIPEAAGQEQGEASMPPQERDRRGDGRAMPRPQPPKPASAEEDSRVSERVRSSPLARRLASERGVELDAVQGSGPGGRIVKRDVEAAAEAPRPTDRTVGRAAPEGDYQDIPLTQMRKTIARRLAESIGPVPTFYLTAEYDLERVAEMRTAMTELGDEFKVSFNDIVLKAVATALAQHPEVNAHWLGDGMRYFNRVHLGLAVAVEDGLITPVIFDADRKRLSEISAEARELAGRARERRLKPDEYTGATFTVSNLGMFGIEHFTAIINPPEAGILAVGAIEQKPVVVDGEVQSRRRMRVTMSCDHRVIDGATGAKFLQTLRRFMENPLMLVY
ncbi:MAG TPA: 2-oxo acid dehydrogenase subunit E2, partial [Gemmatimonadaceae bacterium]|nr:2-oxo acid dehydrogenase subunit E2 [Gemmatimonadaceae bacterium]